MARDGALGSICIAPPGADLDSLEGPEAGQLMDNAEVACREAGIPTERVSWGWVESGGASDLLVLEKLSCKGTEARLADCPSTPAGPGTAPCQKLRVTCTPKGERRWRYRFRCVLQCRQVLCCDTAWHAALHQLWWPCYPGCRSMPTRGLVPLCAVPSNLCAPASLAAPCSRLRYKGSLPGALRQAERWQRALFDPPTVPGPARLLLSCGWGGPVPLRCCAGRHRLPWRRVRRQGHMCDQLGLMAAQPAGF